MAETDRTERFTFRSPNVVAKRRREGVHRGSCVLALQRPPGRRHGDLSGGTFDRSHFFALLPFWVEMDPSAKI